MFICIIVHQNIKADEIYDKGKKYFITYNCATCHTLADAGSNAYIGPNLNEIRADKSRIVNVVKNGIGVMPAFTELSTEQIEAVAHYVSIAAEK